ncbi:MAG: LLM class F420-dependent oxidoreductase [Acidimicrobiales bacterium]|jgi:probable F420-dependent oxidoreductase|nr:LLM class F420-dependent oxidoreductase [Acidimicrobiales bacterium]
MRYGLTIFATDLSMDLAALAREAEDRDFASLYVPEHTHIPTSRRTPPPTGDEQLREEYKRTLDPFVALAAAASVTERIKLGTGILLPAQREPIVTAKAAATLDHVSNGRAVLGIGFGWNEDELEHHGVTMRQRRAVTREHVLAMRALWTQEEASFDGEFVRFSPSWSWPKPVQPRLPVLLGGGAGPILFRHIAEYGDGWIPIGGAGIAQALPDLHRAVEDAGRDPATLEIVPFGSIPDPAKLDYFASIGVTECVFRLPSAPADEVMAVLDRWTALLEQR